MKISSTPLVEPVSVGAFFFSLCMPNTKIGTCLSDWDINASRTAPTLQNMGTYYSFSVA